MGTGEEIFLKQLVCAFPYTNSFIVKSFLSSWVSHDFFPHWSVNGPCFVSVTIKLALHFEKLPIFITIMSKKPKRDWGVREFSLMKVYILCTDSKNQKMLRETLHSPPPKHSTQKICKNIYFFQIQRTNEAQTSWLSLEN